MSVPVFKKPLNPPKVNKPVSPGEVRGVLPDFSGPAIGPGDGKVPMFTKPAKAGKGRKRRGGDPLTSIWNTLVGRPKPKDPVGLTIRNPGINGGRSKKGKTHRRRR